MIIFMRQTPNFRLNCLSYHSAHFFGGGTPEPPTTLPLDPSDPRPRRIPLTEILDLPLVT